MYIYKISKNKGINNNTTHIQNTHTKKICFKLVNTFLTNYKRHCYRNINTKCLITFETKKILKPYEISYL